jgi:hypothetical protein
MSFFSPNKIKFADITNAVQKYLVDTYRQAGTIFTSASPFGQILQVMATYSQLFFLYLEDALVEMNILTASKEKSIFGWSRLAGHNPTRALSAQGTIRIKFKPTATSDINASYILILDETKLTCENNGLPYFIQLGNALGNLKINLSDRNFTSMRIIQGEIESQTVTGNGLPLQSFNFQAKKPIENEMVYVTVNGEPYEIVDSMYDMRKGEKLCIVKTGIIGGIDLYFGNEDYGVIPPTGSNITVKYVTSNGFQGNIFSKSNQVKFKWKDSAYTNTGEEIDLNEVFDLYIEKPIILGADSEDVALTKLIAPKTSRSYVLANTDNYVSFLSRFNYSYVDAYTTYEDQYISDDNVVYLFLIPDIKRRLNTNTDYFTTNLVNFYLDTDEKDALKRFINKSGQQIVSTELSIVDPVLTRYALNIFLRIYDTVDQNSLKNEVINKVTDYLLTVNRRDKIPKSDVIAILENVTGIDSVNIAFISEVNETAINDGYYIQRVTQFDKIRGIQEVIEYRVPVTAGSDPNLGLDEFGDIKIGLNELPVIRGGWYDRFGNFYQDGIDFSQYSSVNIIIKEVIKESLSVRMNNKNKQTVINQ